MITVVSTHSNLLDMVPLVAVAAVCFHITLCQMNKPFEWWILHHAFGGATSHFSDGEDTIEEKSNSVIA